MSALDHARERAKARRLRVVFPESDEPRVAAAMVLLSKDGLAEPIPLGPPSDAQVQALVQERGLKEALARKMLDKPLIRAAAMVAAREADVMVAGANSPTRRVIEAAGLAIGLADGVSLPSSFFLMRFPDGREMVWADCAVNVAPDAEGLAAIARASVKSALALLGSARPAFLSFSTGQSGAGASVETVRAAAELTGFPGPLQADAALNPTIAAQKSAPFSDPNVLIFPSLDAGNIAYKLAQELAKAQALGPCLQGFRRPVCDLSRGATTQDIVNTSLLALALAQDD